jgi:catechol 2,3-dioxygenase-like lactoylglutathione lyase family enzyme
MSVYAAPTTQPAARAVDHVVLVVSDVDRSANFYSHVLDFRADADRETARHELESLEGAPGAHCRAFRMSVGDESIELVEYLAPTGRPIPSDSRSNDGWFQHIAIITSDMDQAYARLRANRVRRISTAPQRLPDWNPRAGGIRAFYFLDPDGHVLEVLQFPPGKGEPRWQQKGRLFLGIDHTAIVIFDTFRSIAFYRDALGMRVAGTSENWGDEQEHLNNVRGAHLRITTLRATSGPGVELLEYLAPRDGRPYPGNAGSSDLASWQIVLKTTEADSVLATLRAAHAPLVSSSAVPDPLDATRGRALIVRDPDGHAIELIQTSSITQAANP